MIIKLLTIILLPATLILTATAASAHSGHMSDSSLHGLLHIEHIITLLAIGVIAYLVTTLREK